MVQLSPHPESLVLLQFHFTVETLKAQKGEVSQLLSQSWDQSSDVCDVRHDSLPQRAVSLCPRAAESSGWVSYNLMAWVGRCSILQSFNVLLAL